VRRNEEQDHTDHPQGAIAKFRLQAGALLNGVGPEGGREPGDDPNLPERGDCGCGMHDDASPPDASIKSAQHGGNTAPGQRMRDRW